MTASIKGEASASRPCRAEDPKQRDTAGPVPRRRRDALGLGNQASRARQVASPRSVQRQRLEVDRQLSERARLADDPGLPLVHRDRLHRPTSPSRTPPTCTPHRTTSSAGRSHDFLRRTLEDRHGGRVSVGDQQRKPFDHQVEWMRVRGQRWKRAYGAADLEKHAASAEMVRTDGRGSTRSGRPCERG